MKLLDIYLDTSVINFLFADDAPEKRAITIDFFENWVKTRKYDVYISSVVVDEINATPNLLHRQKLLDVLNQYPLQYVEIEQSDDIALLAELYIAHRIIPQKKVADALHIAIATVNRMDILLSWNYRHLANVQRKHQVQMVNIAHNYVSPLEIVTPLEVMSDEVESDEFDDFSGAV